MPFEGDGCTWFPDGDWVACCDVHDAAFATGRSLEQYLAANLDLLACITGYNWLAAVIAFLGVMSPVGAALFFWGRKRAKRSRSPGLGIR